MSDVAGPRGGVLHRPAATSRTARRNNRGRLLTERWNGAGDPSGALALREAGVRRHHGFESAAVAGGGVPLLPDPAAPSAPHPAAAAWQRARRPSGHLL